LIYCIDTSALLEGWDRYYPPEVFPSVWDNLDNLVVDGKLIASDEVLAELLVKGDLLAAWVTARPTMFVAPDAAVQAAVTDILSTYPKLIDPARQRSMADPFVIAVAQVRGAAVVSLEKPVGPASDKVKIPNVCQGLGIPCMPLLDMFRREGWTF
jgi:hypothetical protein